MQCSHPCRQIDRETEKEGETRRLRRLVLVSFVSGNRARQMRSIVKLKSLGSRPVKGSADLRDPRSELKVLIECYLP